MMRAVVQQFRDVLFYVMLPEDAKGAWAEAFEHERIHLLLTASPPRQGGGAFHFDAPLMDRLADLRRIDVDVLLLNQPELVPAFLDYFNKRHFFHIPAISYIHWLDWRRYDALKNRAVEPSILAALTGAVLSAKTACNSEFGKRRVLELAKRWFAEDVVQRLASNLVTLHPGIDRAQLERNRSSKRNRMIQIIVPHRAQKYTGFKTLIESYLPRAWRVRRDFQVILTNPSRYDYVERYQEKFPFVRVLHLDRSQYFKALWEADIVVGSHVGCNQWSIATLEAICANCVPLLSSEGFYREMLAPIVKTSEWREVEDRWFYFRGEFVKRLLALMDNIEIERERARVVALRARRYYDWRRVAGDWVRLFRSVDRESPTVGAGSKALRILVAEVRQNGKCSKADLLNLMGWHPKSRHIPWTKYRRGLLKVVRETDNSAEAIFYDRPKPLVRD